ncbi:MAG TPA: ATP-binding protein [Candidatus Paceibacterota bacterium]
MSPLADSRRFRPYSVREWRIAAMLLFGYLAVYMLSALYVPATAQLFPASAVALGALFFGGMRLWPIVFVASLAAALITGAPAPLIAILPVGETLQAVIGAYLLRLAGIDPLFRRYRDTFYFIAVVAAVALIMPALRALGGALSGMPYGLHAWGRQYTSALCCLLIITPFILRWFAKARFSRTPFEWLETAGVFVLLLLLDYEIFINGMTRAFGLPLYYLLLVPLFWIALRLRPRFVTLALLATSVCAIWGAIADTGAGALGARLFETEASLIVLATAFFIIVSLEEDRRLNTNLMRSQMSTLENALARISSESKAKNDFIAILAHELRNPLAPVVSAIELLKLKGARDAEDAEALEMMEGRMATVRRLLDDLLDISRISEGKLSFKKETLDLEAAVRRAILSTSHHLKERHQSLEFRTPATPLHIEGDPVRVEQIFSNLITNASKYSDSGETVFVSMREDGDMAQVEVADEGVGISPEDLEAIFTPFHQVGQNERTKKGLGIGLALVRNFVEMQGGSVAAASAGSGRGSRFVVRLPVVDAIAPAKKHSPLARAFTPRSGGLSVLIVDDNDAAAAGIGRLLELQGCRVAYAYDGAQGIDAALTLAPDVVILDIGLPDQDGYAAARTMRARGFRGRLIALTGYSTEEARARGKDAGFEQYLVKPAGLAELRRVLPEIQ